MERVKYVYANVIVVNVVIGGIYFALKIICLKLFKDEIVYQEVHNASYIEGNKISLFRSWK